MSIIELKTNISKKKGQSLENEIAIFISEKEKVICKALNKRPIFLERYLEITRVKRDKNARRQKFWPGIELITKVRSNSDTIHIQQNQNGESYEFKGVTSEGVRVTVHIREELTKEKNKKLYLISTF